MGQDATEPSQASPHVAGAAGKSEPAPTYSANFGRALPITKTRTKIGLDTGERQRHGFFDGLGTASEVRRAFPIHSLAILYDGSPFPPFAHFPRFQPRRHLAGSQVTNSDRPALERRPKWHRSRSELQAGVASRLAACSSSRAAAWPPSSRSSTTSAYVDTDPRRDREMGIGEACECGKDTKTSESRLSLMAPASSAASPSSPALCSPRSLSRSSPAAPARVPSARRGRLPVSMPSGPRATGPRRSSSSNAASPLTTSTASRSCG